MDGRPARGAVGLDTAPLIYFVERHHSRAAKIKPFFGSSGTSGIPHCDLPRSLIEVLIQPFRNRREDLVDEYRDILLRSNSVTTMAID
jgi:hypothetical protein